ncbi:MAG: hypothetical protein R2795_16115 [Saprospiraceae bacterium]
MRINYTFLLLIILGVPVYLFGQLEVTNTPPITPENLISNVFLGDGVEVISIDFDGDPMSVGYFSQGLNTIGMERGL